MIGHQTRVKNSVTKLSHYWRFTIPERPVVHYSTQTSTLYSTTQLPSQDITHDGHAVSRNLRSQPTGTGLYRMCRAASCRQRACGNQQSIRPACASGAVGRHWPNGGLKRPGGGRTCPGMSGSCPHCGDCTHVMAHSSASCAQPCAATSLCSLKLPTSLCMTSSISFPRTWLFRPLRAAARGRRPTLL